MVQRPTQKLILLFLFACLTVPLRAQYLHLLHTVQFPTVTNPYGVVGSSDCWGWADSTGTEYAIIGNLDHIAFVRASDGQVIDQVTAPSSSDPYYHRDIKTYGHYAYIVGECTGINEGLTIVDLSPLPDSVRFVKAWNNGGNFIRGHNLDIDEGTGHLYIESDEFIGAHGVEIVDINDPENPVKVGFINTPGVHDVNARNDTAWVAEGSSKAYSVWNCADKGNPILLGRVASSNFGYCHNVWPSADGKFFVTGEETPNKTVKIWDATNMSNITQRGTYLAVNNLVHNVHVEGNYLFMSHYTAGVRVVDWSDPDNPQEIAGHDTYDASNIADFYGCWGVYPHSAAGYVYGSNLDGKLFIYEWLPTTLGNAPAPSTSEAQAWPNPFSTATNIPVQLSAAAQVRVVVYDQSGRMIAELFDGELAAGTHNLPWQAAPSLAAGVYHARVQTGADVRVEKLVLAR